MISLMECLACDKRRAKEFEKTWDYMFEKYEGIVKTTEKAVKLLTEAREEIQNCHGRDTELTEKIAELLDAMDGEKEGENE